MIEYLKKADCASDWEDEEHKGGVVANVSCLREVH